MTNHLRGALIGLAVGDALGAAVEFSSPGSFAPVTGYRSGGPHGLKAGEWTDDTSMALALADSIGEVGWDLNDQARRYVEWWKTGKYSVNGRCFDIGITTRNALSITLTTVGYGDVTPLSTPARTCAWLEALTGQFYLAVLVAGLVGALNKSRQPSGKTRTR